MAGSSTCLSDNVPYSASITINPPGLPGVSAASGPSAGGYLSFFSLKKSGATAEFFKEKKLKYPPADGQLAALTPGNPGGLMTMLAEFGTLSLKDVLEPAIQMADGYPIEAELVRKINNGTNAVKLKKWPYSKKVFFPHTGQTNEAPQAGELWRQPDLLATLQKLVDAEAQALKAGKDRKSAILAAYDRFYKGDIAEEFCRGSREQEGLHTVADLANWKVKIEEPATTTYKGIT